MDPPRRVLGASRLEILELLVAGAMRTIVVGLGAGVAISLALAWLLKDAFLGAAFDPKPLVVAAVALAATASSRSCFPSSVPPRSSRWTSCATSDREGREP